MVLSPAIKVFRVCHHKLKGGEKEGLFLRLNPKLS
jgi:hypothetical protein